MTPPPRPNRAPDPSAPRRALARGWLLGAALAVLLASPARAAGPFNVCVYDPSGESGPAFAIAKDYKTSASMWGTTINLRAFTNEEQAKGYLKDPATDTCHAAVLTGVTARQVVRYSGSIEALGGVPTYALLQKAIARVISDPAQRARMKEGDFETVGIFPAGEVYLLASGKLVPKDGAGQRKVPTVKGLKGRRIATIKSDQAALTMVKRVEAVPVDSTIADFAKKFINGQADACYAPASAVGPLGLTAPLKAGGGVIHYAMSPLTFQILIRTSAGFPEDFKTRTLQWAAANFDAIRRQKLVPAENTLAPYWVELPEADRLEYDALFRSVRKELSQGASPVYDPAMVALIEEVRAGR